MAYHINEYDELSVKLARELIQRYNLNVEPQLYYALRNFIDKKTCNVIPTADTRDDTCDLTPNDVRKTITIHAMPHDPDAKHDAYDPALNIDPGK